MERSGARMMHQLKVGDTVWVDGFPQVICGETRVSWKIKMYDYEGEKPLTFPKKPERPDWIMTSCEHRRSRGYRVYLTKRSFDEARWMNEHRYAVAKCVERADFDVLYQIAKLVGYAQLLEEPCDTKS